MDDASVSHDCHVTDWDLHIIKMILMSVIYLWSHYENGDSWEWYECTNLDKYTFTTVYNVNKSKADD